MSDPRHIASLDEFEGATIQVAALMTLLGISRNNYHAAVQAGHVKRSEDGSRPLFLESVQGYVAHVRRLEENEQADLDRVRAQTGYSRQRQINEELRTKEKQGALVPAADMDELVDELAASVRRFMDESVTELVRLTAPKKRAGARVRLTGAADEALARFADSRSGA